MPLSHQPFQAPRHPHLSRAHATHWRWVAAWLATFGPAIAQADVVVAAHSQYFRDWTFSEVPQRAGTIAAGTAVPGTLGGRAFTIVGTASTTPALSRFQAGWSSTFLGSLNLPIDIGLPSAATTLWEVSTGELVHTFSAPLPSGTTLFSHDFDSGESVEYRFYRCDGSQVDASGFEFLRIADPGGTPSTVSRPAAGAADSAWRIAASDATTNNTTSGLILRSSQVCKIKTFSRVLAGTGTVDFLLGTPPPPRPGAAQAVPALGAPALALLGAGMAGLAGWRRRRAPHAASTQP